MHFGIVFQSMVLGLDMVRETKLIMRPKRLYGFLLLNIAIPRDRSTSWGLAPMKWMSKS